MKNRYLKRSHISEAKFRQVVRLFCEDLMATQITELAIAKVKQNLSF